MATAKPVRDEFSVLVDQAHAEEHDHEEFIGHHFDTAEQQFDSGKLGIWLFLVNEVLFFSGLFVVYIGYRYANPEIFIDAHVHLDKWLGGLNTIVLLFSSLTMAWAVRAAQLGKNKVAATSTLITMFCAMAFLGVKAVEYSHKWDLGLLPGRLFDYDPSVPAPHHFISNYLYYISAPFALLIVLFFAFGVVSHKNENSVFGKFWMGMVIAMLGYFAGAAGGVGYQHMVNQGHEAHAEHGDEHTKDGHGEADQHKTPEKPAEKAAGHASAISNAPIYVTTNVEKPEAENADSGKDAAKKPASNRLMIFFSIYYCMTGLHALHIIFGVIFLAWIYYRSLAAHWRPDYFGPVDYVGLYWHLVDLVWIYLFPLMYLIK